MDLPRFERATRRAFLRRGLAATGALTAAGAALAACSKSDAETFATTTSAAGDATTTAGPTATTAPTTTNPPTTKAAATTTTSTTTTTTTTKKAATTTTTAAAGGAAVGVAFAYTAADSGGRVRNPYVAIWVEDQGGDLAALIGVWYSTREAKYVRELTDFTAAASDVESQQLAAVSGATRAAGTYQLHWDSKGLDGTSLTGSHVLWVEAAREHGPHSVTSGPIQLPAATSTTVAGNGELSDVTVSRG